MEYGQLHFRCCARARTGRAVTLHHLQPIALGLSLLVIAEIGLFQFAGTHQIGWLVMTGPWIFAEDLFR